ncbi:MAG: glycosyltransferase family 9 protein [Bdellovibrionaceae bacterium]|nr:glycosyltransferase family 9 protein [Pseudobdellovibrionaceae bacterium]
MTDRSPKILAIRLDKIGDLVSTLPADAAFPEGARVVWVIAKGLGFLPEHSEPRREFHEISLDTAGRTRLREILHEEKPDMTVLFYGPWWAAYEAYRAGVPARVGRRSQWWSYLFLNRGLRQSRSASEKHEAQYNFELAAFAGPGIEGVAPSLKLKAPLLRQIFEKFGLRRGSYVVVHPGMAGSALNWPTNHYVELIRGLLVREPKTQVLVTGTKMDRAWTEPVLAAFKGESRVVNAVDAANLRELLFLLENARAVVVPSTGVAHLAASLGTPTRAIYSPVRAHASKRWGPRGADVRVFEPATVGEDPALMATIPVAEVLASIPSGTDA